MAMRIHELHPTLVHFPLVLYPLALAADLAGRFTGSRWLMRLGAKLMPVAAASGAAAAAAGFVAQEAVQTKSDSHDLLITHRNLNVVLVAAAALLAASRSKRQTPSLGYLAAGLGGLAVMSYTAYLGGKMVYAHGVGVEAAGGVRLGASPELTRGNLSQAADLSAQHVLHGVKHAVHHVREGQVAPALRSR